MVFYRRAEPAVFARVGFSNNWDNEFDYPLAKTDTGFEATIPALKSDTLNICFGLC